jgi:hypothetical protein
VPPYQAYDPLQLSLFAKKGAFKDKKVGLFGGSATDNDELTFVDSYLKKLHVDVVQSAVDSAPPTDQVAEYQEAQSIAARFQNEGVNEVVAVGTGSDIWPAALQSEQSAYNPRWVATQGISLLGTAAGKSTVGVPKYFTNVRASVPNPNVVEMWKDPAIKACVSTIKKAYPSDAIATPTLTTPGSEVTFESVVQACQNMAIFTKIADAAGKHLTASTFAKAGYGLRDVTFPGEGGPVSFGSDQPYALGPVYPLVFNRAANELVTASTPLK